MNEIIANMNTCAELDEDLEFEEFLDKILRRSKPDDEVSAARESLPTDLDEWIMAVQPGSDDVPLWRVECRVSCTSILTAVNNTAHLSK